MFLLALSTLTGCIAIVSNFYRKFFGFHVPWDQKQCFIYWFYFVFQSSNLVPIFRWHYWTLQKSFKPEVPCFWFDFLLFFSGFPREKLHLIFLFFKVQITNGLKSFKTEVKVSVSDSIFYFFPPELGTLAAHPSFDNFYQKTFSPWEF